MASSFLLTARCVGKSGFRTHFPCNPKIDVVNTKVQTIFPLTLQTLYHVHHAARFSTCHRRGNYTHASSSALEEEYEPSSSEDTLLSETKPGRPERNVGLPNPQYPATSLLARKILKDYWGYPGFRLEQEAVISRLIAGGSASVVFPTGSGKSLLYQIPALAFDQLGEVGGREPGVTLVISPLIALMKDQTEDLVARGIKAATIDSSVDREAADQIYNLLENNELKLLYCSPERLINENFIEKMRRTRIHMIAIDEAHCVLEWGNSFRPDYLKIAKFVKEIGVERTLCLTATAITDLRETIKSTPKITADICSAFGIPDDGLFRAPTHRPNLQLLAKSFQSEYEKLPYLKLFLAGNPGASIIYVTFRLQAEHIAGKLVAAGIEALPYHAGMSQSFRAEVQERFMEADNITIVATIAFGLGINKPDVRNIVHFDSPRSLEGYSQEIGRAGRDGRPSKGILFLAAGDSRSQEMLRLSSMPSKRGLRRFFQGLFKKYKTAEAGDIIESETLTQSENFDILPSAINILYSKLELRFGLLRAISPRKSSYFTYELFQRPLVEEDTSDLARAIIKMSKFSETPKGTEFGSIDIKEVADTLDINHKLVMGQLKEWDESRIIDLGPVSMVSRYRMLKPFPQTRLAARELIEMTYRELKAQDAESAERSEQVTQLITDDSCYARGLAAHFGDINSVPEEGCGNCQWCLTEERVVLEGNKNKKYRKTTRKRKKDNPDMDHERIDAVLAACPDRNDPELLAKIAFGVKSPKILRDGYGPPNKVFGSMAYCNFRDLVDEFQDFCDEGEGEGEGDTDELD